jgi:nitroreductase
MDVLEAIRSRRSVRKYTDEPVSREFLVRVLDAARWAPSAGNWQPWRFVVVTDPVMVRVIEQVAPGFHFEAPSVLIVVCWQRDERCSGQAREHFLAANCYIAAQNIVLSAWALGLGTCMIGSFAPSAVAEVLSLPDDVHPETIIAIGYPQRIPKETPRLALDQLAYLNRWGEALLE